MTLSSADVEHVAALARIGLTEEQRERLREELSAILDHIDILNQLDTSDIAPTAQVLPLLNVLRTDEARPSLSQEEALANAPHASEGFFAVQAVLTGSEEEQA